MARDISGFETCKQLRRFSEVPVLFLSARDAEIDRVVGLEIGADDYLCKPYSPREVVARVKAMFRRLQRTMQAGGPPALIIDESAYRASFNGHALDMTPVEILLLKALRERGIDVPKRLSVIGFDDLEETAYTSPPLTTLRQDFRELGNRAMNLLLSEIAGASTKKLDRLIPELVLRASTTAPPKL